MNKYDIKDYYVPTKQPLPCLYYDLAVYCDTLKKILSMPLPEYLSELSDRLDSYAKQMKKCKPKEFPKAYRIYIMDYRLNLLFAGLDTTGKVATFFSKYGKFGHCITDSYYGDGSKIGDVLPWTSYNFPEMMSFLVNYGFLPIEELAAPVALVFDGEELSDWRLLSQYQLCLLMERFSTKNLIDWKARIQDAKEQIPF